MKFLKSAVAASVLALCTSSASAAILQYSLGNGQGGNQITSPNPPATTTVYSGSFTMTDATNALGLGTSFQAFCLDILTTMAQSKNYSINNTNPFNNSNGVSLAESLAGTNRKALIQNLFDSSYGGLSTNAEWTAFGLALWEAVFEEDPTGGTAALNVTEDVFDVVSSVSTTANNFLSAALSYNSGKKYNLFFLENARDSGQSQNLVTATVVPLPAAGLLLVGALGALAAARRRRAPAA